MEKIWENPKKQSVIRTPIMASPGKKQEVDAPVRANPKKVVAYADGRWCHTSCSFRRNRRKYELRHHVQGDLEKLVGQLDFDAVLAGNLRQLCNFNTAGVDQSIDSSEKLHWQRLPPREKGW